MILVIQKIQIKTKIYQIYIKYERHKREEERKRHEMLRQAELEVRERETREEALRLGGTTDLTIFCARSQQQETPLGDSGDMAINFGNPPMNNMNSTI